MNEDPEWLRWQLSDKEMADIEKRVHKALAEHPPRPEVQAACGRVYRDLVDAMRKQFALDPQDQKAP